MTVEYDFDLVHCYPQWLCQCLLQTEHFHVYIMRDGVGETAGSVDNDVCQLHETAALLELMGLVTVLLLDGNVVGTPLPVCGKSFVYD